MDCVFDQNMLKEVFYYSDISIEITFKCVMKVKHHPGNEKFLTQFSDKLRIIIPE